MSYRDDDAARAQRAGTLIDEIAALEREKVKHAMSEQRLEAARRELATLQVSTPPPPAARGPGAIAHLFVFGVTASAAYLGYTLLM